MLPAIHRYASSVATLRSTVFLLSSFHSKNIKNMKRLIKFRGASHNGMWHYGFLVGDSYGKRFIESSDDFQVYTKEVIPESVGQFTGVKDKDGKDVYEGDILLNDGNNRQVKWSNQNAQFYLGHTVGKMAFYKEFHQCGQHQSDGPVHLDDAEIIGNIYENQEMLT